MADFDTVLIKDSRIADITDRLSYAVRSGASSNTYQQFSAVSTSASAVTFNAQIPSEAIVIDREVLVQTDLHFTITITDVPVNQTAFNYGSTDAFQAFPLNSLFTTSSCQINNTNVSCNLQDVLPSILRLNSNRELYRYNGMTPTLPDQAYKTYADGVGANNNPLAGYTTQSYDGDLMPRGAWPATIVLLHNIAAGGTDAEPISTDAADTWTITVSTTVTEPLMGLSPFIFGDSAYNKQGIVGINAMSFVMNIDSTCKRMWSTSNAGYTTTINLGTAAQINPFTNTRLLMNFLSTQPTDLISARNVVPYLDLPRYLSLQSATGALGAGASASFNSQNIQINQLCDYFIITVRKPMSSQTIADSSSFMKINSISVNLNNTSGLLSSATSEDLWRLSVANHSTQSWPEFSGSANVASNATGVGASVNTTGSMLILAPAKDLSLPSFLSSGSIGQYNFQFNISVTNNSGAAVTPEICVICVNSGLFSTIAGSSNIYTGILSKSMVLDAQTSEDSVDAVDSVMYSRLVGGSMLDRVASAVKKIAPLRKLRRTMGGGVPSAGGVGSGGSALDRLCY